MRPHSEFLQSQWLPWTSGLPGGLRQNVDVRTLSTDPDDGACSLIVRYPPGFHCDAHALTADEELFVLSGSFKVGDVVYGAHDYAHLPRLFARAAMRSSVGAEVLTFFSSEPQLVGGSPGAHDAARLVLRLDTRAMQAHTGPRRHMASEGFNHGGTVHKLLFDDPLTLDKTWIAGLPPYWRCDTVERHPVCEEEFAIAGDIHMPNGVMHAGAYFWRPANVPHGPFGTVGGTIHLCRGKGGRYATEFSASDRPFNWDPPYEPILPAAYRAYVPEEVK
ncbi:MAG: cupin domain-containing protein [Steroidobacteraceae bacterium]